MNLNQLRGPHLVSPTKISCSQNLQDHVCVPLNGDIPGWSASSCGRCRVDEHMVPSADPTVTSSKSIRSPICPLSFCLKTKASRTLVASKLLFITIAPENMAEDHLQSFDIPKETIAIMDDNPSWYAVVIHTKGTDKQGWNRISGMQGPKKAAPVVVSGQEFLTGPMVVASGTQFHSESVLSRKETILRFCPVKILSSWKEWAFSPLYSLILSGWPIDHVASATKHSSSQPTSTIAAHSLGDPDPSADFRLCTCKKQSCIDDERALSVIQLVYHFVEHPERPQNVDWWSFYTGILPKYESWEGLPILSYIKYNYKEL